MQALKDALILLRFPFSFFLMPVFLFGTYLGSQPFNYNYWLAFFILHFLVYPASNGYNSHEDKDEDAIGGIKKPPPPNKLLFYVCMVFDLLSIILSLKISYLFTALVVLYIAFSRAYSSRKIRLKKRAILSYFIIAVFQGCFILILALDVSDPMIKYGEPEFMLSCLFAFFLMGGSYPITQIYQHESDAKDGIITLSARLGISKTLLFSEIHVGIAMVFLYFIIPLEHFVLFIALMTPVLVYMQWWKRACKKNPAAASFRNTMTMNLLATSLMNVCFGLLIYLKHA
ncbi:UbiA family prenyltransferase [Jiulongibacter sp. NS-SX5]|uniref:UbiA family prenyltransferase n=1 Tax=Jiulongibacter sp. NS-SX5 TaxID=3463854 RepID=UPI0040583B02